MSIWRVKPVSAFEADMLFLPELEPIIMQGQH